MAHGTVDLEGPWTVEFNNPTFRDDRQGYSVFVLRGLTVFVAVGELPESFGLGPIELLTAIALRDHPAFDRRSVVQNGEIFGHAHLVPVGDLAHVFQVSLQGTSYMLIEIRMGDEASLEECLEFSRQWEPKKD